jgi:hypothetical protein
MTWAKFWANFEDRWAFFHKKHPATLSGGKQVEKIMSSSIKI